MTRKTLLYFTMLALTAAFFLSACRNPRLPAAPAAAGDTPTNTQTITAVMTSTYTPQETATLTHAIIFTPSFTATRTNTVLSPNTPTATATVTSTSVQASVLKDSTYFGLCDAPLMPTPHSTVFIQNPETAQLMKATSSYTITRVEAYVYAVNVPNTPGNLWAEIQGVDAVNGVPDDIPLSNGVSAMVDINTWLTDARDGKVIFYFTGCPVNNTQKYSVVFKWDSGQAQLLQFPIIVPADYPDGYLLVTGAAPAPYQSYYQNFYGKWMKWLSHGPVDDMFIDVYGY